MVRSGVPKSLRRRHCKSCGGNWHKPLVDVSLGLCCYAALETSPQAKGCGFPHWTIGQNVRSININCWYIPDAVDRRSAHLYPKHGLSHLIDGFKSPHPAMPSLGRSAGRCKLGWCDLQIGRCDFLFLGLHLDEL